MKKKLTHACVWMKMKLGSCGRVTRRFTHDVHRRIRNWNCTTEASRDQGQVTWHSAMHTSTEKAVWIRAVCAPSLATTHTCHGDDKRWISAERIPQCVLRLDGEGAMTVMSQVTCGACHQITFGECRIPNCKRMNRDKTIETWSDVTGV